MSRKPRVYLSGRIAGLQYNEANGWRQTLTTRLDSTAECINPLAGKREHYNTVSHTYTGNAAHPGLISARDLHDVRRSDALFVKYEPESLVGTLLEMGVAWERRIPTFVWRPLQDPIAHPLLLDVITYQSGYYEDTVKALRMFLQTWE